MKALTSHLAALKDIATPALVVDGEALQRNVQRMADFASRAGVGLRPHAKTHKCREIAERQRRAGAIGISCATAFEAEALAQAGVGGLLLTTPTMGADKFARLAALNRRHGLALVVDHADQVAGLLRCLESGDRPLAVAIDVDVGQARTGVTTPGHAVELARMIVREPRLEFIGIQGFAGQAQHIPDPAERKAETARAAARLRETAAALTQAGSAPRIVTGSGTGTYGQDFGNPYNELQPGSYVFMDADYARIVDEAGAGPAFEPSLFVLATVVSVNRPGEATVDAGVKALATNGPLPRHIIGAGQGAAYRFAGDEHGIVSIPAGHKPPALGDRLLIGATHCDPTVNLHACYHVVAGGAIERWPILGRYGCS